MPDIEATHLFAAQATLLVLPAFGATHRSLLASGLWKESLPERFDRLIREDECPPALPYRGTGREILPGA